MIIWRYGLILPLAGGITLGLAMIMKASVSTEFVPQPTDRKSTTVASYIFEQVIICGGYRGRHELTAIRFPLLIPPYSKVTSHPYFENPHEDRQSYIAPKPTLPISKVDIAMASVGYRAQVCTSHALRLPPKFPIEFLTGDNSGSCQFSFTYSSDGRASEIEIISCTHERLATPTLNAVKRWSPISGDCIELNHGQRQFSTMRYDLMGEDGRILPLP